MIKTGSAGVALVAVVFLHPAMVGKPAILSSDAQPQVEVFAPPPHRIDQPDAEQRARAQDTHTNVHLALALDQAFKSDLARGGAEFHNGSAASGTLPEMRAWAYTIDVIICAVR